MLTKLHSKKFYKNLLVKHIKKTEVSKDLKDVKGFKKVVISYHISVQKGKVMKRALKRGCDFTDV
jgi:patatin-like phospholipase/acyl hydrolase